ncbi:MAG: hypothetical protein ACQEWU_03110 [Bacillota bacterium]
MRIRKLGRKSRLTVTLSCIAILIVSMFLITTMTDFNDTNKSEGSISKENVPQEVKIKQKTNPAIVKVGS